MELKYNASYLQLIVVMLCCMATGLIDLVAVTFAQSSYEFNLSNADCVFVHGSIFISFALGLLPAAILANRIGRKNTAIAGLLLSVFSLIFPISDYTFCRYIMSMCLLGLSNALLQSAIFPLITNIVYFRDTPSAISISMVFRSLAALAAPSIILWGSINTHLTFGMGWKIVFLIYSVIVILATTALSVSNIPEEKRILKRNIIKDYTSLLKNHFIIKTTIAIACTICIDATFVSMAPAMIAEKFHTIVDDPSFYGVLYLVFRTVGNVIGACILKYWDSKILFNVSIIFMLFSGLGLFLVTGEMTLCICIAAMGLFNANLFAILLSRALFLIKKKQNEICSVLMIGVAFGTIFPTLCSLLLPNQYIIICTAIITSLNIGYLVCYTAIKHRIFYFSFFKSKNPILKLNIQPKRSIKY